MATNRRKNLPLEEVLERIDAMEANPSIVYDSSESEIKGDEAVAVFPENSARIEDNSGENPPLSQQEECESSSESEVVRREYVREQQQESSRQLREAIGSARGRTCGMRRDRGAVRTRGVRAADRAARLQDGGHQYVWLEEGTRGNLKQFTSSAGLTRRAERRQAIALGYFELFFTTMCGICY